MEFFPRVTLNLILTLRPYFVSVPSRLRAVLFVGHFPMTNVAQTPVFQRVCGFFLVITGRRVEKRLRYKSRMQANCFFTGTTLERRVAFPSESAALVLYRIFRFHWS
jgi:hypothetical protein